MKKIKFLLPLFVLFIALFTSCDSQMKEPEYTVHQDEWKIDESLWGKKFKLLTQQSDVATEGALFGYLEITADGSDLKITVQESDESLFAPYKGLKELYDEYKKQGYVIQILGPMENGPRVFCSYIGDYKVDIRKEELILTIKDKKSTYTLEDVTES